MYYFEALFAVLREAISILAFQSRRSRVYHPQLVAVYYQCEALYRNFAFGEYLLVLPLTSELDALCDGKCEPDSALPSARGATFGFMMMPPNEKDTHRCPFRLARVDKKDATQIILLSVNWNPLNPKPLYIFGRIQPFLLH